MHGLEDAGHLAAAFSRLVLTATMYDLDSTCLHLASIASRKSLYLHRGAFTKTCKAI